MTGGDATTFHVPTFPKGTVEGLGIHEAPRGTLSHWVVVENGVLSNYQAVVPTTWNAALEAAASAIKSALDSGGPSTVANTILIGVSSLIPFPFIDDVIAGYFRGRLIWRLAKKNGIQLSSQQARQLGQERGFGFASGCLMVLSYLLEETLQTFLPWLKWQKGMDRATDAYYSGYLWDLLLSSVSFDANCAAAYGRAVERAKKGTNPALVKNLIRGTFSSSKGLARDVARGLILACERGRCGEAYILGGERTSLARMWAMVSEVSGRQVWGLFIPFKLAEFAARFAPFFYRLLGKKPAFTPYSLETVKGNSHISHAKAFRELGYLPRPLAETIRDTVEWWRARTLKPVKY